MNAPAPSRPPVARTPRPAKRTRAHGRTPHPWYAEVRGGSARWVALAMFVTLCVPLVAKAAYWQGNWHETQDELHNVTALLGGPLAAAAGCWQGGRERRSRMAELRLSGARSPLAQFLMAALPVLLGALVGHLVVVAGALLASWPYVSAGRPLAGPPAADAVYLAAMVLGGMVVGRLLRWRLAAPALAVCAYVGIAIFAFQTSAFRFLSPVMDGGGGDRLPLWWQPWAMAAWTAGLACAAALGYAVRRHRYVALLPLAVAVAAAVPVVRCGADMWHPDPLRRVRVCDDSLPQVCVDALDGDLLPAVSRALSGITGRLDGVPNVPVRFVDPPRDHDEAQLPQLYLGQSVVRGELADPEQFAWEAAAGLTVRDCRRGSPTDDVVLDWLASNHLSAQVRAADAEAARKRGDAADVARSEAEARELARLRAMADGPRRAWLGRYFATVRSCDLSEVPTL